MSEEKVSFSRKELYDLVWSTPLSRLAKTYAISDNGLRKICKKHQIPLPILGYWQKLQYGKKVRKIKLPKSAPEETITLFIRKEGEPDQPSLNSKLAKIRHEQQNDSRLSFEVKDNLHGCDRLVSAARKHLTSKEASRYYGSDGLLNSHRGILSISVSKANLHRSLRIIDRLISLLKLLGHLVGVNQEETYAQIDGEKIVFRCREIMKQVPSEDRWRSKDLKPSGKLAFIVYKGRYTSKTFQDSETNKLEAQLRNILARFILYAEETKQERIQAEIRQKEREERERIEQEQYKIKEDQFKAFMELLSNSIRWTKALHLREYLAAVEQQAITSDTLTDEMKSWLEWARAKADWYDPLIEKEDEVFNDINRDKLELPRKGWW